jgi:hypothetical protein
LMTKFGKDGACNMFLKNFCWALWWPKMGFDCHPKNLDGWMAIKKIQLLVIEFGKRKRKKVHVICFWKALVKLC